MNRPIIIALIALALAPVHSSAQGVIWNESANGDLSNNPAAPTALSLLSGTSSIIGKLNGTTDSQDYQFDFTVAPVPEPSSLILAGLGAAVVARRIRRRRR